MKSKTPVDLFWGTTIIFIKEILFIRIKKCKRLNVLQKSLVLHDFLNKKSIKEIMNKYKISKSTIYTIVRKHRINKLKANKLDVSMLKNSILLNEEKDFIKEYVKPPQNPLTIKRINLLLDKKIDVRDRKRDIKNMLKDELLYSFKKEGSTTIKGGSDITSIQQSIFSSRMLKMICDDYLIINIDECSF